MEKSKRYTDILKGNKSIGLVFAIILATTVLLLPLGLYPGEQKILAVTVLMVGMFVSNCAPLPVTGLIGCFLYWVFCDISFPEAFSGFSSNTPWFVLAALFIGAMANKTGIPERLAYLFLKHVNSSYAVLLAGLIVLDFILTIVIPSGAARVVVLCGIAVGLVKAFGLTMKSNIAKGMILVLCFSSTIFDKSILAGAASLLSRGVIESYTATSINWGHWFISYIPVDLIIMGACWFFTLKLFPPEISSFDKELKGHLISEDIIEGRPINAAFIRTAVLLLAAVVLWATDFLHGIPAAAIAIGVSMLAFLPKPIGVLDASDFKKTDFSTVVFVGTALSMGTVLADTTVLTHLSDVLFSGLAPFRDQPNLLSCGLYLLAFVFHIFLGSETALLSTSMPMVMNFATSYSLNPEVVGMIWTFAAGGKLFLYQSPIIALAYSYQSFTAKDLFKLGFVIAIVELFCVALVVPFYWQSILGVSFYV